MSFLVDFQIKERINSFELITNYIDLNVQLQPNSFELTIDKIYSISDNDIPIIDFDNASRKISRCIELDFIDESIHLKCGFYKVLFNEIINIPSNLFAFGFARSSLIRSGTSIETAFWDSGYIGKSECMVIVYNKNGIIFKKNARILQLIFYELNTNVSNKYSGRYMYENIHNFNKNKCDTL